MYLGVIEPGLVSSRLRKNSLFRRNTAKSRLAANYASVESETYTHHRAAISGPLLEIGVFLQPASGSLARASAEYAKPHRYCATRGQGRAEVGVFG